MTMDLTASGPKVLSGDGGGTSGADPFTQYVRDTVAEAALGGVADAAWSGVGSGSAVAVLKAIFSAVAGAPSFSTYDGSGTITAGGVAQDLFGGTIPANGYMVQNLSANPLYVNELAVASAGAGSILIPASGSMWITPQIWKPDAAISIFGGTTGQAFTARRW